MARDNITPEQLLRFFDEAASSVAPFQGPIPARLYTHPPLYPGEQIILQQDQVTCIDSFDSYAQGVLHLTTYRVLFTGVYVKNYFDKENSINYDADAEELSRQGSQRQSFSAKRPVVTSAKINAQNRIDACERQGRIAARSLVHSIPRTLKHISSRAINSTGLRYTQSLKKRSYSALEIPGLCDQDTAKLRTFRPIILSNLEHIAHKYDLELSVACTSIYEIRRFSKKQIPKGRGMFLFDGFELLCSNIQSHRFCLGLQSYYDADNLIKLLLYHTRPAFPRLFAFAHKNAIMIPRSCSILDSTSAPNFYKFKSEFKRLGLLPSQKWRVLNHYCIQYPTQTIVPAAISDAELNTVAVIHRSSCFPAVCWQHSGNGAVMLRSAAAVNRRGLVESRCEHDEKLLTSVCLCNDSAATSKLAIFTEQTKQSGTGILNTGQLTPEQGETFYYPNCKFVYTDSPPDYNTVRQSSCKLQAFLATKVDDSKYMSLLEETEWLSQVCELLQTATQAAVAMDCDKSSVLFSYEDGCDRTAQVASLAQLLLEPFYRTRDGFQILVQKEWLSFGHKFAERVLPSQTTEEHGPVFIQWLDCVWQVTQQFPFSFEFNDQFLETIAESTYSSRFGTFLANSEKDREEEEIDERTTSLWTWLNVVAMSDTDRFLNLRYRKNNKQRALFPRYHVACLKLWTPFYSSQFKQQNLREAHKAGQIQGLKLEDEYMELMSKYSKLLQCLADVDSKDPASVSSFYTANLQHNLSKEHVNFELGDSNTSLSDAFTDDDNQSEEILSSMTSILTLASTSSYDAISLPRPQRRMTRSRSLDDMLDLRTIAKSSKRPSLKRKVGGSKFYTEQFLNELNREPRKRVAYRPIPEKYSSLQDYLSSTGVEFNSEPSVQVTDTYCCGYMTKQGQVRKNWKKRWFVLDLTKKYLAYFETDKTQQPKGAISYQSITRVYEHRKNGRTKRCLFCLDTPGRTYIIESPNEKSMNIWMTCLTIPLSAIEVHTE